MRAMGAGPNGAPMTDHAPDPAMLAKAETLTEALPYLQRYAGKTFVVHQLSTEGSEAIDAQDDVTLTWPVEDSAILRVGADAAAS